MGFLRRARKPPPIPYILPRTPPQPPNSPYRQRRSPLFGKLPPELRIEIFTLVLDCSPIPLCAYDLPRVIRVNKFLYQQSPHVEHATAVRQARLISLLLTCWRAYTEALPILYGVNTFSIGSCETMRLLATGVGPGPRLIRRLEFHWHLRYPPPLGEPEAPCLIMRILDRLLDLPTAGGYEFDYREWKTTWESMRKLEGLESLHIRLELGPSFVWQISWEQHEMESLRPLISMLKGFNGKKLTLTWLRPEANGEAAEDMLEGWVVEREVSSYQLLVRLR